MLCTTSFRSSQEKNEQRLGVTDEICWVFDFQARLYQLFQVWNLRLKTVIYGVLGEIQSVADYLLSPAQLSQLRANPSFVLRAREL